MAKALKIVAIGLAVGALALTTAGFGGIALSGIISTGVISTGTIFGVAAALEVGASLLSKKGSTTASQTDRLTTSLDPRTPRKTVLGRTAMANDLRYEEWFGADQEYCGWIIALASHKIDGLDEIWINQEMVWSVAGGVTAKYQGYFYVQKIVTEGSPSNTTVVSSPDAGKWNTSSRLTGCAYVHIQFRVTGVNSKATSPFSSLPSRLTLIGRGGMLYDPRRDGTVPGGTGLMRAGDQGTWRFEADDGAEIGNNIPLQILRVLLGWRITNPATGAQKLAVGCGLPPRRIDMGSFITGANIADELANVSAGGNEPKFHGAAVLSEGDDPHAHLDMLLAACNGRLREVNGKLALAIMHNDLAGAAADDGLNDNDVIGGFTWESDPPLDQCINVIRGKYTDPSTTSLYQQIDYPEVRLDNPDGIDRVMTLDLSVIESASHAQRVAKQVLERRQYQRTFTAPFDIRAWKYRLGDVVPFTLSALSFDRHLFRVAAQELGQDGQCVMSLVDENAAIYLWDADDAPAVAAAEPTIYDPTKSPLILAIGEAAETALWPNVGDPVGTKPEDNATVGATIGVNLKKPNGALATSLEVINPALVLAPDGRLLQTIAGVQTVLGTVALLDLGAASDSARRQLEADLASLSAAVAQLAAGQSIVQNVFRDAGLYTDAASGIAKLYAVESRADQLTNLDVTLNAAVATIGLKASVNYVDQAVLAAQLGGSNADLSSIFVRLTSAEVNIDGLAATVQLKADATVVTGLQGTVSSVQASLDAINATILLKADQTQVTAHDIRLTTAESTLSALDGASISQAVTAARLVPINTDAAAAANIIALLGGDQATQTTLTGISQARQDLNARVDGAFGATAVLSQQLAVQIGTVTASLAAESSTRITADQASAATLTAYQTTMAGNVASINTAIGTVSTAQSATAQQLSDFRAQTGNNLATITTNLTATTTAQGATAASLSNFMAQTNDNFGSVSQSIVAASSATGALAGTVQTLSTTVGGHTSRLTQYGQSIDGVRAKWGVEINSNGVVTGFALNNESGRTDITFVVDGFRIAKSNGDHARTVFNIADDGTVQMPNVEVDRLKINTAIVPAFSSATDIIQGSG